MLAVSLTCRAITLPLSRPASFVLLTMPPPCGRTENPNTPLPHNEWTIYTLKLNVSGHWGDRGWTNWYLSSSGKRPIDLQLIWSKMQLWSGKCLQIDYTGYFQRRGISFTEQANNTIIFVVFVYLFFHKHIRFLYKWVAFVIIEG